jgi:hypothetical protein
MTTDNFCFYLQNRLIQTSPTGQRYSDTSPFSIPWLRPKKFYSTGSRKIIRFDIKKWMKKRKERIGFEDMIKPVRKFSGKTIALKDNKRKCPEASFIKLFSEQYNKILL